jgi:hypothetical protein
MLTERARRARRAATVLVAALLLAGTFWGDDDHFPFGPFRMYSTTNEPSGTVKVIRFEGLTAEGATVTLRTGAFGLRPAEVDGQRSRFRQDPGLLRHLVTAYERFNPGEPQLVELRLLSGEHQLRNWRPVSYREETLAVWRRS